MDWFLYDNRLRHERVKELFQENNVLQKVSANLTYLCSCFLTFNVSKMDTQSEL